MARARNISGQIESSLPPVIEPPMPDINQALASVATPDTGEYDRAIAALQSQIGSLLEPVPPRVDPAIAGLLALIAPSGTPLETGASILKGFATTAGMETERNRLMAESLLRPQLEELMRARERVRGMKERMAPEFYRALLDERRASIERQERARDSLRNMVASLAMNDMERAERYRQQVIQSAEQAFNRAISLDPNEVSKPRLQVTINELESYRAALEGAGDSASSDHISGLIGTLTDMMARPDIPEVPRKVTMEQERLELQKRTVAATEKGTELAGKRLELAKESEKRRAGEARERLAIERARVALEQARLNFQRSEARQRRIEAALQRKATAEMGDEIASLKKFMTVTRYIDSNEEKLADRVKELRREMESLNNELVQTDRFGTPKYAALQNEDVYDEKKDQFKVDDFEPGTIERLFATRYNRVSRELKQATSELTRFQARMSKVRSYPDMLLQKIGEKKGQKKGKK